MKENKKMKLNATILMVMFIALSGFTWGSSEEDSKSKNNSSSAYSNNAPMPSSYNKKTKTASSKSSMTSSVTSKSTYSPMASGSGDQRANAVRILTAGDEATRKARMESLTRIAKAVAAKKRTQETQLVKDNSSQSSYQY
jgi:hypothetical protein